jgi:hypothetical protein
MRAMNEIEVGAVFGGTSGIEPPTLNVEGYRIDPSLYPECPGTPLPGGPTIWPGDPSE